MTDDSRVRTEQPMPFQGPRLGQTVLYKLSEDDASTINGRRYEDSDRPPDEPGQSVTLRAGDVYPFIVTRVREDGLIDGLGFTDGPGTLWVLSVPQGEGERHWQMTENGSGYAPTG